MNRWLVAAAVLSAVACLVHLFVGGPAFYAPALTHLGDVDGAILSAVWHGVSLILAINTVAFALAAQPLEPAASSLQPTAIALSLAVTFLGFGLVRLSSLTATPQWTIFLLIGVLGLIGWRRRT